MKMYSLENVKNPLELQPVADALSVDSPCVVALGTLSEVADCIQEISLHLYHIEPEVALQRVQVLEDRCLDWLKVWVAPVACQGMASSLHPREQTALFRQTHIELQQIFGHIRSLCEPLPCLTSDRELMADGAALSTLFLSLLLQMQGKPNAVMNACRCLRLGIDRKPDWEDSLQQVNEWKQGLTEPVSIYLTQLDFCRNVYGETCLLPQGGSDCYAAWMARLFQADTLVLQVPPCSMDRSIRLQIPRRLTYGEAENLIDCGATFVSPECLAVARAGQLTVEGKLQPFDADNEWSIQPKKQGNAVKAVVTRRQLMFLQLQSKQVLSACLFIGKVFDTLARYQVQVHAVATSNVSLSLAVNCSRDTLRLLFRELNRYAEVGMETDMALVSVVGDLDWQKYTGLESRIIETLKDIPVCMISYGGSAHNLSVLVREPDREAAECALEKAFL